MRQYLIGVIQRTIWIIAIPVCMVLTLASFLLIPLSYILIGDKTWLFGKIASFMDKINPDSLRNKSQSQILYIEQNWDEYKTITFFTNNVSGIVSITNYPDTEESYIHGLFVTEHFRHCRIATKLLDEADKHADYPVTVWIKPDAEEWLQRMYNKRGYTIKEISKEQNKEL